MIEIRLPDLGQTTDEVAVVGWHKKVGDQVKRGDVLLEVETDKAVTEIESYADGVLQEIRCAEGSMVKTGEVLAVIQND